jgi:chemotaxis family two-component system response regulator Rcp1
MTRLEWILLVEDEADQRLILRATLARLDGSIEVHEAPDAETAMKWLRRTAVDPARLSGGMVVLDLGLPRASGFQVLEWMRDVPALRHLPAVVLTASENSMDADHAFNLGARGYFQKPRDVREYADIFRRAFHIAETSAHDREDG